MIKYLALGVISIILSSAAAGVLSHIRRKPSWVKCADCYWFYLGCAWFVTTAASGIVSAVNGHLRIALVYFILSVFGVALAVLFAFYGGGGCRREGASDGDEMATEGDNGQKNDINVSDENDGNNVSCGQKTCPKEAKDDSFSAKIANVRKRMINKPRSKAILCGVLFLTATVVFLAFAVFSDFTVNDGGDGYGFGDVYESAVIFESCERGEKAVLLKANNGEDTYVIFGYALELCDVDRLCSEIGSGDSFTVRGAVMRRDEWSGYFGILDIKNGAGESYLDGDAVIAARASARTEKLAVFGAVAAVLGGVFGFYTVLSVREAKKKIEN